MTDTRCILIRKQIMLSEQGRVAPCCNFLTNIPIDDYENVAESYAKQLDEGNKIPECNVCWQTEEKGFTSVRQSSLLSSTTYDGDGITAMDIRLHNKCNLACNMCGPSFSTLWGKLSNKKTPEIRIPDNSANKAIELSKNLRRLSMQGGEPFFGNEYVDFVDKLPHKEKVSVDVFSNMITIDFDVVKRWSYELEELKINASVDGIGKTYENIRWPTTWKKFERNAIETYKILGGYMTFFYTIQAENISCIREFIEWRNEHCPNSKIVYSNVFHNDEVTIKGLTQDEINDFLNDKDYILSIVPHDESNDEFYNREYNDLLSLFSLIEKIEVSSELIEKRKRFNENIKTMREKYKEK